MQEKNQDRLTGIEEDGQFLFVYSDKHDIYTLYQPLNENVLYMVTTDKEFVISRAEEVEVPVEFYRRSDLRFFRPDQKNDGIVEFKGLITIDGDTRGFVLSNLSKLTIGEVTALKEKNLNIVSCLDNVDLVHCIIKGKELYVIGYEVHEDNTEEPFYGVVDLITNSFKKIYYLHSDKGSIYPTAINIDRHSGCVYVVGKINKWVNNTVVTQHPFIEQFLI